MTTFKVYQNNFELPTALILDNSCTCKYNHMLRVL